MGVRGLLRVQRPEHAGGVVYLLVLAASVLGVVLAAAGPWRAGVSVVAATLLLAALARLRLPQEEAGMLGVRGKLVDVVMLLVVSGSLLLLVVGIPEQLGP
ncbi:DUF3017 domain-containing protein [Nocardioidaceae bacterium]|nr:DUF3017 domain-containing protein [Nocardioidaceae bacterium]